MADQKVAVSKSMTSDLGLRSRVGGLLARHKIKLMLAESMTGGAVSAEFSVEEHAGDYLLGSIVCYNDEIKQGVLGISADFIEEHGGVSAEVSAALVDSLAEQFSQAQLLVSITGFSFDSQACSKENPVGTVYIHLRLGHLDASYKYILEGTPEQIVQQTVQLVLFLIEEKIHQLEE